jgi:hypothetical protein
LLPYGQRSSWAFDARQMPVQEAIEEIAVLRLRMSSGERRSDDRSASQTGVVTQMRREEELSDNVGDHERDDDDSWDAQQP